MAKRDDPEAPLCEGCGQPSKRTCARCSRRICRACAKDHVDSDDTFTAAPCKPAMTKRAARIRAVKVLAGMVIQGEPPGALTDGLSKADVEVAVEAWENLRVELRTRVERMIGREWNPDGKGG